MTSSKNLSGKRGHTHARRIENLGKRKKETKITLEEYRSMLSAEKFFGFWEIFHKFSFFKKQAFKAIPQKNFTIRNVKFQNSNFDTNARMFISRYYTVRQEIACFCTDHKAWNFVTYAKKVRKSCRKLRSAPPKLRSWRFSRKMFFEYKIFFSNVLDAKLVIPQKTSTCAFMLTS